MNKTREFPAYGEYRERGYPSFGYIGTIARINLTEKKVTPVKTSDYAPKFIGGRGICNKIFWDEVGPGVKAFDPENKCIMMTGPGCGTGVPTGGRTNMCAIAPNNYPEQYCWGNIGGWVGPYLKFAGFDGVILEGRADTPTCLLIEDGEISFHEAGPLWGTLTHECQEKLEKKFGKGVASLVIGPAGENLVRNASITTCNDNVYAKAGFGAVWGSKNLKSVSIRGSGTVKPFSVEKVLELRKKMGYPQRRLNPVQYKNQCTFRPHITFDVPQGVKEARVACSFGCNQRCNIFVLDTKSAFPRKRKRTNQVHKCVGIYAFKMMNDSGQGTGACFHTKLNYNPACLWMAATPKPQDPTDAPEDLEIMNNYRTGNKLDFWDGDYDRGNVISDLCTQYGVDKWDLMIWYMTWFAMGKKTGLLDDIDLGMEIDPSSEEFMAYFLDMVTYRKGYWGNLFAEGMYRALKTLGEEKYADAVFHPISNTVPGLELDIPVSWHSAWGHCFHWQGRGFQGIGYPQAYLQATLMLMTNTRDAQTNTHVHSTVDMFKRCADDPCHSPEIAAWAIHGENHAELKESLPCCDWQGPDVNWEEMECEMLYAATGMDFDSGEIMNYCERSKNLFRAVLMRNHGRCREQEVDMTYPPLQFPDADGRTFTKDEFNDLVDMYYDLRGWDKKTGWPTRETWERCGLPEVADELEALGKLPK
ncbi:MAG: aldehyde ferredoxin oxidoreductase [Oscillospiraceae bacterium]|nr:aldehyde ferredoxin oxidoreductase [Oscillospiraceae bacterium]